MRKYLYDYIKEIDDRINKKDITKEIVDNHLIKIGFFQHERLIHLLVTLTYAIFYIILCYITTFNVLLSIGVIAVTIFLVCYIYHYFKLENGVQYLYKQYDIMMDLLKK